MRGRKPSSARLKALTEVQRPSMGSLEPPPKPDWLDKTAGDEWDRIVPELAKAYVITPADAIMLATYCQTYADWLQAERTVREEGQIIMNLKGEPRINPAARYASTLLAELRRTAVEFGLTPVSRARIQVPPPGDDEDDDMEAFLDGTGSGQVGPHEE